MSQYDRFTLQGGLDLSTPYIKRDPGSLLQSQNFECDTDGGYRVMRGYERYDGRPSPSQADMYAVSLTPNFPTTLYRYGAPFTATGGFSVAFIREVDGQMWFDARDGYVPKAGDVLAYAPSGAKYTVTAASALFPDVNTVKGITYNDAKLIKIPGLVRIVGDGVFINSDGDSFRVMTVAFGAGQVTTRLGVQVLTGTIEAGSVFQMRPGLNVTVSYVSDLEDYLQDFNTPQGVTYLAQEARRDMIGQVPGSGPVRGVWDFKEHRYAFRDNIAGTQGVMYEATAIGWTPVALGSNLQWTGRPNDVTDLDLIKGDTLTGATSGATAVVGHVGYIDQEHKTGFVTFITSTGAFTSGENLTVNGKVVGVAGATEANVLPPGGLYRFFNHNFAAGLDRYSMYGVNGTGRGFAFDGVNFAFIRTGSVDDRPFEVKVHYDHLFFAFPFGSLQHSVVGNPLDWSGGTGALELGMGAEITDLILTPKSLIVCTEKDIQVLLGTGLDNWTKDLVTSHTGVRKFTGAYQSQAFVVARPGLIAIDRVDSFGNFADAVISDRVRDLITSQYDVWGPAIGDKTKSQYRMYGGDGSNLVFTIYQGELKGIMPFRYDRIVRNVANPQGRIFFTSDDGFVYESDVGVNNDGEERQLFLRTSYANQGDPDTRKRFRRAAVSITGEVFRDITLSFTFSKGKSDTPNSFVTDNISGAGGRWAFNEWDRVYWDGPDVEEIRKDMDGVGSDVSMIIYQSTRVATQYILEDVSFEYDVRRKNR